MHLLRVGHTTYEPYTDHACRKQDTMSSNTATTTTASASRPKTTWILLATILGSSMAFIDANVVNVALPRIQSELNASGGSVQWVVESYSLFLGALILVGGSLGDRYGRKRMFIVGILIFALASIWCGLAADIIQLIIARAIQGIGGALLTPESLAILRASIPDDQRGKAIGLWSGFSSITSALGPVIGGWLVQNASWRWVFFINIPLGIIVLLILFIRVPESRNEQGNQRFDLSGVALTVLGLGVLLFSLIESDSIGLLNPLVLIGVLAGIVLLICFVLVERRQASPMMPLQLFRSRVFSGTNLLTFFLYATLGGALFFFPFLLQNVQGYTPTAAGFSFLPFTLLMFALSRWSGGLVTRYGARLPLVVGPIIVAFGYLLFTIPGIGGSYWTTYFPAVILLGLGMAITVAPLTTTVMGAVAENYAGVASGINNAVSRIAGLLAIARFGIFVSLAFNLSFTAQLSALHLPPALYQFMQAQSTKLTAATIPSDIPSSTHAVLKQAIDTSFLSGFRLIMFISAALALASALCSFLTIPPRHRSRSQPQHQCGDNGTTLTYAHRAQDISSPVTVRK